MQVVNLQVQLASLKEQASQSFFSGSGSSGNPDYAKFNPIESPYDVQTWFQSENASMVPPFDHPNSSRNIYGDYMVNPNSSSGNFENSAITRREDVSFSSLEDQGSTYTMDSLDDMQTSNCQWTFRDDLHDLQSAALGYIQY